MQTIPKIELFPHLSGRDLLQLCQVDTMFRHACQDDRVWEQKIKEEYPEYIRYRNVVMTWRQYYLMLVSSPPIPVMSEAGNYTIPSGIILEILSDLNPRFAALNGLVILDPNRDDLTQADLIITWNRLVPNSEYRLITPGKKTRQAQGGKKCVTMTGLQIVDYLDSKGVIVPPIGLRKTELCYITEMLEKNGVI